MHVYCPAYELGLAICTVFATATAGEKVLPVSDVSGTSMAFITVCRAFWGRCKSPIFSNKHITYFLKANRSGELLAVFNG